MGIDEKVLEQFEKLRGRRTLILTTGSSLRGDDGAGPSVFDRLRNTNITADLIDAGCVPENYIQPVVKKAPQNLIIIDAVDFSAAPGTVRVFSPEQLGSVAVSTHSLSPQLFIDMIRSQIDVEVFFVGIEPGQTDFGRGLSPVVAEAVEGLAEAIIEVFARR